ncbi:hypothetical protein Save01_04285 [Streptomyces avermitilis]|uniref:Uncharacterized protein n=1 Tax=Streptomyces avermitilis TaxID=33903 RepID=A0A4D4M835_STRAX|nr:hypothetical protein SAVMC3_88180 [Streptomyces avermitilis]GDY68131.1 hypothetical protein SAV14893_075240 [Streptomyces avermitilis]GDY71525.1 hypothetical protein SAV31267_010100 [Streptomyces avermitilis]
MLREQGKVHHPNLDCAFAERERAQPPGLGELMPSLAGGTEAKTPKHSVRQLRLRCVVHAKCALQGDQPGVSSCIGGQDGGKVVEHFPHPGPTVRRSGAAPACGLLPLL